jgi:hypothetical protein
MMANRNDFYAWKRIVKGRVLAVVFLIAFAPGIALADCADPDGVEGMMAYNTTHKTAQFCDGTTWWGMKGGGGLPTCPLGDYIVMTSTGWDCDGAGGSGNPGEITASSYHTTGQLSSSTTTPSITGLSIGAESANRWVVAAIRSDGSSPGTTSGVTIGGVSATIAIQSTTDGGEDYFTAIAYAKVPTGTTADVNWTLSAAMSSHVAWVYTITYDDTEANFTVNTSTTCSVAHVDGGVTIGVSTDSTSSTNITWTNALEASENDLGQGSSSSGYRLHSEVGDLTVSCDGGTANALADFRGNP